MTHLFEGACCQPLLGLQKKVVTKTALATHEFQALNSENLALKAWVGLGALLTYLGVVIDSETLGILAHRTSVDDWGVQSRSQQSI